MKSTLSFGPPENQPSIVPLLQTARLMLAEGKHAEGARILRQAFDRAPTDGAVASAITQVTTQARTFMMLGQPGAAFAALGPLADSKAVPGDLLILYGCALMALNRKNEAEEILRRVVKLQPGNREAILACAAVLTDNGRSKEAESQLRAEIVRAGATTETSFVLGRALLGQSRFEEAEAEFRKVVHARPDHQTAHANLMELVWMRTGDAREALLEIDKALRVQPDLVALRITKARLLTSARAPSDALTEIEAGVTLVGQKPALLAAGATIAIEFDGNRALDYARRLYAVAPQHRVARVAFGNALLATGHGQDALGVAELLCRSNPADGQAQAMKADALRMLGDPRYQELLDYHNLVRAESVSVPAGWGTLEGYLADLTADLQRVHTLRAHPIGNSLREGSQIQLSPEQSEFASIRAFPEAIDGPINRYLRALGKGQDAMRSRNTGRYRISGIWSVRLRAKGFHVNHYHPEGWISSACYLQLPPAVKQHGGEGWLRFGEPAFQTKPAMGPEYFLKPEPGLLALFPSYMWHGTVPFSGSVEDTRLTIAFDVLPLA